LIDSYFGGYYFFFVVFFFFSPFVVWSYTQLGRLEDVLLSGARNVARVTAASFFFRMFAVMALIRFIMMANLIRVDSKLFIEIAFFVFPFLFCNYLIACDIYPPKRKTAPKIVLQS
jgi:uncharacterized membrane protein